MKVPVIRVCGPSDSGKTTLIEKLVPLLKLKGLRVGTVKHAHHGFSIDHPGKDSWRHTQAGADATAVVGPDQSAWLIKTEQEFSCEEAVEKFSDRVDLVLVEGFKRESGPAIVLEPDSSERLAIGRQRCTVGVEPSELKQDELEMLVDFCTVLIGQPAK